MVLQDTCLFEGTIRDNIAFGNPSASKEQIAEAARAMRVDFFVRSLLVLEHGDIVEQGNHAELVQRSGAYARLYNAQFVGAASTSTSTSPSRLRRGRSSTAGR